MLARYACAIPASLLRSPRLRLMGSRLALRQMWDRKTTPFRFLLTVLVQGQEATPTAYGKTITSMGLAMITLLAIFL